MVLTDSFNTLPIPIQSFIVNFLATNIMYCTIHDNISDQRDSFHFRLFILQTFISVVVNLESNFSSDRQFYFASHFVHIVFKPASRCRTRSFSRLVSRLQTTFIPDSAALSTPIASFGISRRGKRFFSSTLAPTSTTRP